MNNNFLNLLYAAIFSIFLLSGCSDVSYISTTDTNTTEETTTPTDENTTITGQFVDAYVQDLNYTCSSGLSGLTTSTGSFTCNIGDNITFILGDNNIATVAADLIITPYTLFPTSVDSAINLARLLQSIDDDGSLTNSVISLNKILESSLPSSLDFASATFEADVEAALGIQLVDANDAQTRMNESIVASGGTISTDEIAPLANAGSDATVALNATVNLDASASVASTYTWSFTSLPVGSTATLSSTSIVNPTFVADLNGTYVISLVVDSAEINSDTDSVSIFVNTVATSNNAPVIAVTSTLSVAENQSSLLTISASDADGDTLIYSITGADAADFSVNSSTGVVTFVTNPDFETKSTYSITTVVSDGVDSDEQNVSVTILDIAEVPVISATTLSIDENMVGSSNVGSMIISSHGDSVITSFSLSGTGYTNFNIDASGVVTTTASLDYEDKQSYTLSVYATNAVGDSTTVNLVVNVNNLIDITPTLVDTSLSVREDAADASVVGTITISDAGDSTISSVVISGTGNTNFVSSTSGVVSVAAGATLDYETTNEYNLTVVATNTAGASASVNLYLNVNNVIDEVPIIADSVGAIDENATIGTSVGTVTITYVGDSSISSIDLNGTGSEYFSVADDGDITLVIPDILDFETIPSYVFTAIATNSAGVSNNANITITIGNVAEVAVLLDTTISIMENELSGASVGTILFDHTGDSAITDINISGVGSTNFVSDVSGGVTLSSTIDIDFETTPSYTLSAVATNTAGASASVVLTIDIEDFIFNPTKMADIAAGDAELDDHFGSSIAVSGNYIVVGAPNEDAGALLDGGSAYLFEKDENGSVTQKVKLTSGTPKSEEVFGYSVAMDGNVIVVGAPEGASNVGDAYIFVIDSNGSVTSTQQVNLGATADSFGSAVAISGSYIVIGAPSRATAHLYKLDGANVATKVADITEAVIAGDAYGSKVAIDGNFIVIGAQDKETLQTDDGAAYVYEINPATDAVTQIGVLNSIGAENNDHFGSSVGISGSYIVVGAYGDNSNTGAAYLYEISGASVVALTDTFYPNTTDVVVAGDYFAYSMDIYGKYIIAGAYKKDIGANVDVGSAYVYEIDTASDTTSLLKKIDSGSLTPSDFFGASVSVDGDLFVVGAPYNDENASDGGAAYLFDGEPAP